MPRFATILIAIALIAPQPGAAEGDAERGEDLYERRCFACHSLDANRVGPAHRGVFGRKAGTVPVYNYYPALKR